MNDELKKMIIRNYNLGKIKILLCLKALMHGVNLNCNYMFITSFVTSISSPRRNPRDLRNLIGRIGRLGMNPFGYVIFLDDDNGKKHIFNIFKEENLKIPNMKESIQKLNESRTPRVKNLWELYCNDNTVKSNNNLLQEKIINSKYVNKINNNIYEFDVYDYLSSLNYSDLEEINLFINNNYIQIIYSLFYVVSPNDLSKIDWESPTIKTLKITDDLELDMNVFKDIWINIFKLFDINKSQSNLKGKRDLKFIYIISDIVAFQRLVINKMAFKPYFQKVKTKLRLQNDSVYNLVKKIVNKNIISDRIEIKKLINAGEYDNERKRKYGFKLNFITYDDFFTLKSISNDKLCTFILENYKILFSTKKFNMPFLLGTDASFYLYNYNFAIQNTILADDQNKYINQIIYNDMAIKIRNLIEKLLKIDNINPFLKEIAKKIDEF